MSSELDDAGKSLACLRFCSLSDDVAFQLLNIVQPYYEKLSIVVYRHPHALNAYEQSSLQDMAGQLSTLVGRPFCDQDQTDSSIYFHWKSAQSAGVVQSDAYDIEALDTKFQTLDLMKHEAASGVVDDGMIELVSGLRPGTLLGGFESSLWNNNYEPVGLDGSTGCAGLVSHAG